MSTTTAWKETFYIVSSVLQRSEEGIQVLRLEMMMKNRV